MARPSNGAASSGTASGGPLKMLDGSIVLLFVLMTQGALTFRNALAAR